MAEAKPARRPNLIRRLYDWVLSWTDTPYASPALFGLAFAESSFFPVPPDVLLIALSISKPRRSFFYAALCSLGSLIGGMFGYYIGFQLFNLVGERILRFYGVMNEYYRIKQLYDTYNAWAVGIAGFTPIPYKVFTIAAGAFKISFIIFLCASAVSRSARFFIVSGLIYRFGPKIRDFIERYFNLLTIVFVIALTLGFILVKYLIK
jgi:membrane protein YqaA with SNARE-associated domain